MPTLTSRTITIDLAFVGPGKVVEERRGVFTGGVPAPALSPACHFSVLPEPEATTASAEPALDAEPYAGTLQVNLAGTSADYRELGRHLELTRFRGRLTRPNFGAEVAHEVEPESRRSWAA